MKRKKPRFLSLFGVIFAAIIIVAAVPATLAGAIITVPDDYPTIQAAISAASPGDTVYVRAGTYYENVTIDKSLTLQGEDRSTTIIDGTKTGDVIYVTASNVTISGFKVINGECGINTPWTDLSLNHLTIRDLIITSNGRNVGPLHYRGGIVIIKEYTTVNAYHIIEDCIISDNDTGIIAYRFSKGIIRNCELFGNGWAMNIRYTSDVLIADNELHHNLAGVMYLNGFTNSTIEKNYIYLNTGTAMQFSLGANYNIIRDNIIYDNVRGINMKPTRREKGNKIYHNDMIGNMPQAYDGGLYPGLNIWDNGYPSGGNFWSDYTGVDGNNDGIGDTPYVFVGNLDNYPLMKPYNIIQVAIDIKPGSDPNSINLSSAGVISVAILSSDTFDATTVDPETVMLSGAAVKMAGKSSKYLSHEDYVNDDDLLDLVCQILTEELNIELGDSIAVLKAKTFGGKSIYGEDTIRIVPDK